MELLKPDDVLANILRYMFGSGSIIVTIFLVSKFVLDWFAFGRSAVEYTRRTIDGTVRAYGRIRRIGPLGSVIAVGTTIAMLAIQALWLASSYIVGNGVALFVLNRPVNDGPHWGEFIASLRWDVVSIAYVALAALALIIQYGRRHSSSDRNPALTAIMVPLAMIGGLAAVGALLGGLMWALLTWKPTPSVDFTAAWAGQFGLQTATIAGIAVLYAISTSVIMKTPQLMARAWQKPPEGDQTSPAPQSWRQDRIG
ncbi:hypothetical protein AB0F81_41200 [Actinoplanes sp. NPDC024001]|uniref:hypothetical protein n=1 Tax=Actinoplanes sp. NPDC024001 TaxID=3154598 RepID=UPI0033E96287